MACDKCTKPTGDNDYLVCQGFCALIFHFKCAGMTPTLTKAKAEVKNLLWFCDECCKLIKNTAFRRSVAVYETLIEDIRGKQASAIEDLKNEMAKTNSKLDKLVNLRPSIASPRIASTWPNISVSSTKRRRVENNTLVPSFGTKQSKIKTVPPPEKKFWVYLGRLHNSVTTNDIEELVMEGLQCDSADVHMLVRKDADLTQLKSVSFKVGIDYKLKDTALSASSWPAGVLFREFEDLGSKNSATTNVSTPNVPTTRSRTMSRAPNPE